MEIVREDNQQEQGVPVDSENLDPSKDYQWDPDAEFTINGQQFAYLLHAVKSVVNTPFIKQAIAADKVLDDILKENYKKGILKQI